MVVLIVMEFEEVVEIIGPFKDTNESERYYQARLKHEPNLSRPRAASVKEPMLMCRWDSTNFI